MLTLTLTLTLTATLALTLTLPLPLTRCSMSNSKELKKIGAEWKALGEEAPLANQPLTLILT